MRKCRFCRAEIPATKDCVDQFQRSGFCGKDHYIEYQTEKGLAAVKRKKEAQAKEQRKDIKQRKEKLKTKSDHAREAQQAFNAWVRERDAGNACISCGRHHQGQNHAGHYRSVGACPSLRYEPLNVHLQCAPCNTHKSGNVVEYRINLIKKIGQDAVDWLEGPHEPKRYTIEQLQEIKAHYRAELRKFKATK